jgi:hypothetical protein
MDMTGNLVNNNGKWAVKACIGEFLINNTPKKEYHEFQLHPESVPTEENDEVVFRVVNQYCKETDGFVNYAQLTPCK